MALSATVVWEVQSTAGSDNYGGGFNSAAAGTDYSLTGTPHVVIDGATITATVQATTTQLKLVGYTVASTDVGNIVNINGGTMTAGRYQINTVTTGASNLWTMDRSCGTAAQTGTGNMGGCLATIQTAITAVTVNDMIIYVKADATYALTAALAITGPSGAGQNATRLVGYTSSRTDGGQVAITVGAGAGVNGVTFSSNAIGWQLENLDFNGAATSGSQGLIGASVTANTSMNFYNCRFRNFANEGVKVTVNVVTRLIRCEVTGCAGTNAAVDTGNNALQLVLGCYIHDNTKPGINIATNICTIINTIIANNTGASSDGILATAGPMTLSGCLLYGNGRDGLRTTTGITTTVGSWRNNIFAKNSGYGLNLSGGAMNTSEVGARIDYNGYWSNSSGSVHNINQSSHDVVITGTDPTNDPFVAKGSSNWTLNNTAGAGTLLRGVGFPGTLPQLTSAVGYLDIGPYQHQYPSSIVIINE